MTLLSTGSVTTPPRMMQRSAATDAATVFAPTVAIPAQPHLLELAGNSRRRDSDDNFDPYGKDDPTNKKWGASAGMGNRYGGLYTGGEKSKEERARRDADRDDRDRRQRRED